MTVSGLRLRFPGSRFRIPDSGIRVRGSGFRVQSSGFRIPGFGFWVAGSESGVRVCRGARGWVAGVSGAGVWVAGIGVQGLGCNFRVPGVGVEVQISGLETNHTIHALDPSSASPPTLLPKPQSLNR